MIQKYFIPLPVNCLSQVRPELFDRKPDCMASYLCFLFQNGDRYLVFGRFNVKFSYRLGHRRRKESGFQYWKRNISVHLTDNPKNLIPMKFICMKNPAKIILHVTKVRRLYLRFWFWIDLISIIPFDTLVEFVQLEKADNLDAIVLTRYLKNIRFAKILTILRVFRGSRIFRYSYKFEEFSNFRKC